MAEESDYPGTRAPDFTELGTPEQIAALYSALGAAQAEFEEVKKDRTVTVQTRERGSYSYDYATLETLIRATKPALMKHGLTVLTPITSEVPMYAKVLVIVAHKDGGRIAFGFSFNSAGDIKQIGGMITYVRRYSYAAILNLAADEDEDEHGNQAAPRQRRQQPQQAPARQAPASTDPQPAANGAKKDSSPKVANPGDWRAAWFALVKGSSLEPEDGRHGFISLKTNGKFNSLTDFLNEATENQAEALLTLARRQVAAERGESHPESDQLPTTDMSKPGVDQDRRKEMMVDWSHLWDERARLVKEGKLGAMKSVNLAVIDTDTLEMMVDDLRKEVRAAQA